MAKLWQICLLRHQDFLTGLNRPSHGKLKVANSCWQTRSFTRQTRVTSQHTVIYNLVDFVQWHSRGTVQQCLF